MSEKISRIKFYGVNDMTLSLSLAEAETKLIQLDLSRSITDINDALELYNIVEFFKTDARLTKWSDETYAVLKKRSSSIQGHLGRFFSTLTNDNIIDELSQLDFEYSEDFWTLFSFYSLHNRISCDTIHSLLKRNTRYLSSLLKHKHIVEAYSELLTEVLMSSESNAEILISEYLAKHDLENRSSLCFPKEFDFSKRESLINRYIQSPEANANYIKLIYEARDSNNLPLQTKTKLAAQKQYDLHIKTLFPTESSYGLKFSFEISIDPDCEDAVKEFDYANGQLKAVYGLKWIENNLDFPTLWNNFIYMFNFVDWRFRCQFVSNPTRQSLLESLIGPKGKSTYFLGTNEQFFSSMYSLMLLSYSHILQLRNIPFESLIVWFFNDYLHEEFHADGFIFNPPSSGTTDLEKCKILATEIDSLLKQFDFYTREGSLDRELFEINSDSLIIRNIGSLVPSKYFYPASAECNSSMNCLFSDQSPLPYTEKYKAQYRTFFDLLRNRNITKSDVYAHNIPQIDFLIQKKCIEVDANSVLRLCKEKIVVLRDLYNNQYCCTNYLSFCEKEINELALAGDIRFSTCFLSEPEQDYFSYVLTKSDYSNGLDLRNKYVHGNYSRDPAQHGKDYLELLKILVIIVIKINEEFCLRDELSKALTPKNDTSEVH